MIAKSEFSDVISGVVLLLEKQVEGMERAEIIDFLEALNTSDDKSLPVIIYGKKGQLLFKDIGSGTTKLIDSNEESIKILFATNNEIPFEIYDNIFINNAEITKSRYDADISEKYFVSVYTSYTSEKTNEKDKDFEKFSIPKAKAYDSLYNYLLEHPQFGSDCKNYYNSNGG